MGQTATATQTMVPVREALRRRGNDVRLDTIRAWARTGKVLSEFRDGQWYVDLEQAVTREVQRTKPRPVPRHLTCTKIQRALDRGESFSSLARRYRVDWSTFKRWVRELDCALEFQGRAKYHDPAAVPGKQSLQLRCLPDLIAAIDASPNPPHTPEEAMPWVDRWRIEERKRWEHFDGVDADHVDLVVLSITPQYILSIVRTKKYRQKARERHHHYNRRQPSLATGEA